MPTSVGLYSRNARECVVFVDIVGVDCLYFKSIHWKLGTSRVGVDLEVLHLLCIVSLWERVGSTSRHTCAMGWGWAVSGLWGSVCIGRLLQSNTVA